MENFYLQAILFIGLILFFILLYLRAPKGIIGMASLIKKPFEAIVLIGFNIGILLFDFNELFSAFKFKSGITLKDFLLGLNLLFLGTVLISNFLIPKMKIKEKISEMKTKRKIFFSFVMLSIFSACAIVIIDIFFLTIWLLKLLI